MWTCGQHLNPINQAIVCAAANNRMHSTQTTSVGIFLYSLERPLKCCNRISMSLEDLLQHRQAPCLSLANSCQNTWGLSHARQRWQWKVIHNVWVSINKNANERAIDGWIAVHVTASCRDERWGGKVSPHLRRIDRRTRLTFPRMLDLQIARLSHLASSTTHCLHEWNSKLFTRCRSQLTSFTRQLRSDLLGEPTIVISHRALI
jgi:hypothetical protein